MISGSGFEACLSFLPSLLLAVRQDASLLLDEELHSTARYLLGTC